MRVLVLFGSSSDEYVYSPLIEGLGQVAEVDFEVISAHRNPTELEERLGRQDFDVIVAGAGIAAHLPGVVASKVDVPVFGVPVEAVFAGMDALLSIQQMPFGVPVATCPPTQSDNIISFLSSTKDKGEDFFTNVHLVVPEHVKNYEYVGAELKRTYELAKQKEITLTESAERKDGAFNIHLVTQKNEVSNDPTSFNVPLVDKAFKDNPYKVTELYDWVKEGGLWVGTNNTRNALLFSLKLAKGRK